MKLNQRQLEKAMKRMGMQTETIDAEEVIIKTADKEIVITNPQITKVVAMGQQTYQIVGEEEIRTAEKFSAEDVNLIVEKTGATEEEAKQALEEEGDIASAIMKLKK